jgi:hypothetical protein
MSSFVIPVDDPGAPRQQTFPDVIRGETVDGFLQRDRFVFATSRRLLVSFPNYSTTSGSAIVVFQGQAPMSPIITSRFWIVGYAEKGTVAIALAGYGTTTQVYGVTAEAKSNLINTAFLGNAYVSYQITVTKTGGEPYVNLYGLAIYEERLDEIDLP